MLPILFLIVSMLAAPCAAADLPMFRAGAARIDITPPLQPPLPMAGFPGREDGHKAIHDNLYVRAIAVDDGSHRGALVTADLIGFSNAFHSRIAARLVGEQGIAPQNLLIAATHTHGGPGLSPGDSDNNEARRAYTKRVEDAMSAAVGKALAEMRPARVGFGSGVCKLNMNRRALFHDGTWWLGFNPDGPTDHTVAVMSFVAENGEPLAILMNYGVHGTSMGQENQVLTADNPGATSRWVEEHFGDHLVAMWTSGAAGDQAPIYDRSPERFAGTMNTGRVLGEEVIRVARSIRPASGSSIRGLQRTIQCPGRKPSAGSSRSAGWRFEDAAPVDIRLSVLMIGDVALTGVSAEVFSLIGQETKAKSPAASTVMITHCNGSSGYIPDDAAYGQISYEIQVTHVKPGCAEKSIVTNLAEMIRELRR